MSEHTRREWTPYKLDELGIVGRGKSKHRPRNDPTLYGGVYPFFQTGDVKDAELYLNRITQTYNEKGLSQSKLWEPGTLCITIAANIAETAILTVPGCFPDSVVGFIADPDKADVKFIKYYLDTIKSRMQSISRGTTQDNLSLDKLLTFDILTPSLATQRRISSILSAYDDLIENNARRIAILEEMVRALYHEWFVRFRFPGHEQVALTKSRCGLIPEGWRATGLGEITYKYVEQYSHADHHALPLLDLARIPRRSWAIADLGQSAEITSSRIIFKQGDILFGAIRPYFHKVVIAPVDGVTNTSVLVFRPRAHVPTSFLFAVLFSDDTVRWANQHSGGTKMPVIGWDVFMKMPVVLPGHALLEAFDGIVKPMVATATSLVRKNFTLRKTRDLLLPRLISGSVNVADLDIDTNGGLL